MRLVYKDTGKEVKVGDIRIGFRNVAYKVLAFSKPHKPASSGSVYLEEVDTRLKCEVYVSIIGAEWIEREDRK